ncbi:Oidioi.mRNA.OKI2018_I69.chr1.g1397.t1.cds [Oikopleura dioica]|uniref:Palmitoyltransferase n=1 Tax=Oikopleura dioica TaxID=34765 RepID=A0ABN7SS10_OIKDI|nr:Oidioi.mRNA.OKI2018_I69.chr1.g1397.t1.cds [Oikopleura dioica]
MTPSGLKWRGSERLSSLYRSALQKAAEVTERLLSKTPKTPRDKPAESKTPASSSGSMKAKTPAGGTSFRSIIFRWRSHQSAFTTDSDRGLLVRSSRRIIKLEYKKLNPDSKFYGDSIFDQTSLHPQEEAKERVNPPKTAFKEDLTTKIRANSDHAMKYSDFGEAMLENLIVSIGRFAGNCSKCLFPKPTGSYHCSVCAKFVIQMDHHLPWINNCVCHFNRRFFLNFCLWTTIGCGYFSLVGYPYLRQNKPRRRRQNQQPSARQNDRSLLVPLLDLARNRQNQLLLLDRRV